MPQLINIGNEFMRAVKVKNEIDCSKSKSKSWTIYRDVLRIAYVFFVVLILCGCSKDEKKDESHNMKELCENHYNSLSIKQRIDALLILADNDTTKVLYSLSMPKQVLERLCSGKTSPTSHTYNMTADLYVRTLLSNNQYMDSLYEDMKEQIEEVNKDKDELHKVNWLLNNSFNEPLQPVWEEIIKKEVQ